MKRKYLFLLFIAAIICIGAAVAYKIWNKPFSDPLYGDAIKVTAKELFNDFSTNETEAQKKYVPQKSGDKALEITGKINNIGRNEDHGTYYVLEAGNENFGVKCIMDSGSDSAKVGNNIVIRGFCAGL